MSLISPNLKSDLMRCIPDQPELSYLTLKHKHMDVWVTWAGTLENKVSKFFSLISLISSIWNAEMKSCTCLMSLSSSNSKADLMRCIPDQPELSNLRHKHKRMDVWVTWAGTLENKVSKFFSLISLISSIWNAEMKSCTCLMRLSSSNSKPDLMWYIPDQPDLSILKTNMIKWMSLCLRDLSMNF